jgi:3-dehydroshikimate dehydratase
MPSPITLSFCSIAFRNEPIKAVVPRLANIGYDAVEVFGGHVEKKSDDESHALRRLADDSGIQLLLIAPYFILTRTRQHFDETMQIAQRTIHAARILGATKIRTFTDVAGDGIGSDVATPAHWAQAVEGLQQITAMDRSIQFVVETHEHTLADTPDACEQLIARVGAPNLKLNFQPSFESVAQGLNAVFDRLHPHITHMHLHQFSQAAPGTWVEAPGDLDFPAFLRHLRTAGYTGSISVEYCWKDVPWHRAQSANAYLRPLLG